MADNHTVLDDPTHTAARALHTLLHEKNHNTTQFIIDDAENIIQAANNTIIIHAIYTSGTTTIPTALIHATQHCHPKIYHLTTAVAKSLFAHEKQTRILAIASGYPHHSLQNINTTAGDIIILDGVRLTGNIGAIIRTACAFNSQAIILINSGIHTILDRRIIRASRGLVTSLPVILSTQKETLEFLQEKNIPLVTLSAQAKENINHINTLQHPIAITMGSEKYGPSDLLTQHSNKQFMIPMSNTVESLNVSVALAITLYARTMAATTNHNPLP